MAKKQAIAVYVPAWLYRFDTGITIFVRGLYRSIRKSENYRLLKIKPSLCTFRSIDEAKAFVQKHNIALVIYHDSRGAPTRKACEKGLDFLESCVPFLNAKKVHVADDKIETKRLLRKFDIPVVPDIIIRNCVELWREMEEGKLYIGKLHNSASGRGVKLIRRTNSDLFQYLDGVWRKIYARDTKYGLKLSGGLDWRIFMFVGFLVSVFIYVIFIISPLAAFSLLYLSATVMILRISYKLEQNMTYHPLMLETFFGENTEEFYCLRCTVIGDEVVESAKKSNKKNVTPNISHGGKATDIVLSKEQKDMAIAATKAVGATYAGVDLLHARKKTIVCEVNVGPIGVYCEQTRVDVGKILGEYAMRQCDRMKVSCSSVTSQNFIGIHRGRESKTSV